MLGVDVEVAVAQFGFDDLASQALELEIDAGARNRLRYEVTECGVHGAHQLATIGTRLTHVRQVRVEGDADAVIQRDAQPGLDGWHHVVKNFGRGSGYLQALVRFRSRAIGDLRSTRWLRKLDPDALATNRTSHDLAMWAAAGWLDPDACKTWLASRRRHFGERDDLLPMVVQSYQYLLQGHVGDAVASSRMALELADAYFERWSQQPGLRELVTSTLRMGVLKGRMLAGELRSDDPELEGAAATIDQQIPLVALWALSEWALLAYIEDKHDLAAELLDKLVDQLPSIDRTSQYLTGPRALVTKALLDSDRAAGDPDVQRRIASQLEPMIDIHHQLRWTTELVCVLLVLQRVQRRAGNTIEADRHARRADLVLGLCPDAPFLRTVEAKLSTDASGPAPHDSNVDELLTDRERAILERLAAGLSYSEIAAALNASQHTIRSRIQTIYRKLGVRSRHGAVHCYTQRLT